MKYNNETGAIVNENNEAITIVPGAIGSVEFPSEFIWQLHKARPGYIFKLAHTHPSDFAQLSTIDLRTLKTWAIAMYPFPIRMSTLTWDSVMEEFVETTCLAIVEPKETWLTHKTEERKIDVVIETVEAIYPTDGLLPSWQRMILESSYALT